MILMKKRMNKKGFVGYIVAAVVVLILFIAAAGTGYLFLGKATDSFINLVNGIGMWKIIIALIIILALVFKSITETILLTTINVIKSIFKI